VELSQNITNAKIWISALQAKYVLQRKFFQKQVIKTGNDGSFIMDIDTSGRLDLRHWVLSMGTKARVLEPEELRRELADEVRRMTGDLNILHKVDL
jgi:predicted DNA-binding transcriptional regulator YafY